jgi:hypothetical protein
MGMRSLLPVVLPFFVWTTSNLRAQSAGLQPALVSGRNYIQPQMITSYADLERKCITFARSNVLLPTPYPTAEALMNVDEKGDLTGTKLLSESKAGWGRCF